MFLASSIETEWRNGLAGCPAQDILIGLHFRTPETLLPGSLACALPNEGTHIGVFYDRILQGRTRERVPFVLAHVLVHEIANLLQGIGRHSDYGIMKARWDTHDFEAMPLKLLAFTEKDVDLI